MTVAPGFRAFLPANQNTQVPRALAVTELLEQFGLEEADKALVRLRGKAHGLVALPEELPQFVAGFLSDPNGRAMIRFRCGVDHAPTFEGAYVEIVGRLQVVSARSHSGLEVVVLGHKVADYQPNTADDPEGFRPAPTRPRTPLQAAVEIADLARLAMVGAAPALDEARRAYERFGLSAKWRDIVLDDLDPDHVVEAARRAAAGGDIVVLALSGSEDGLLRLANDRLFGVALAELGAPLYVALGRPGELTLLDRQADESFETAAVLGGAIAAARIARGRIARVLRESDSERARAAETATELAAAREQLGELTAAMDQLVGSRESLVDQLDETHCRATAATSRFRWGLAGLILVNACILLVLGRARFPALGAGFAAVGAWVAALGPWFAGLGSWFASFRL